MSKTGKGDISEADLEKAKLSIMKKLKKKNKYQMKDKDNLDGVFDDEDDDDGSKSKYKDIVNQNSNNNNNGFNFNNFFNNNNNSDNKCKINGFSNLRDEIKKNNYGIIQIRKIKNEKIIKEC